MPNYVIELDGLRYVWTGSRWYQERDFVTPPIVILRRLDALLPEDAAGAETIAPLRCPKSLRDTWPDPLAGEWLERYPQLFDADDYRCTPRQPTKHFWEWYAAIHLFEREGAYSLVEKYDCKNHPAKTALLESILSESQLDYVNTIYYRHHAQVPDLFVYMPGTRRFWFAEVKGPTDDIRPNQAASHEAIERDLGVPVEVLRFTLADY